MAIIFILVPDEPDGLYPAALTSITTVTSGGLGGGDQSRLPLSRLTPGLYDKYLSRAQCHSHVNQEEFSSAVFRRPALLFLNSSSARFISEPPPPPPTPPRPPQRTSVATVSTPPPPTPPPPHQEPQCVGTTRRRNSRSPHHHQLHHPQSGGCSPGSSTETINLPINNISFCILAHWRGRLAMSTLGAPFCQR